MERIMKKFLILILIILPVTAGAAWYDFLRPSTWFGGDSTINRLEQWSATSSPFSAIAPRVAGKDIYAPYSNATTSAFAANLLCLTGDDCISIWPTGGSGGSGNVGTSSVPTIGYIPYWTTSGATPELLGKVSTTTASCSGDASCTPFTVIGTSPIDITATAGAGAIDGTLIANTIVTAADSNTIQSTSSNPLWVTRIQATSTSASSTLPKLEATTLKVATAIEIAGEYITNFTNYVRGLFTGGAGITLSSGDISFDCSEVEGAGIDCAGEAITLNATGDWTGTIDGNNFAGGAVATGNLLYGSSAGSISELGIGTGGYVLAVSNGLPAWVATTSIPLGGDVTGTLSASVVGNDSHAHTGSTLSGIDISDDTNLTAGDGITLTGDDLDCDTANGSTFGCLATADWTTFNNKQGTISVTWPITLTGATIGFNGLSTSSAPTISHLPYFSGVNTFASVATSSLTINSPLTTSGTAGYLVGGSGFTIDIDNIQAADLDLSDITLNDFTNDANFIDLTDLSATYPVIYNSGTGAFTFGWTYPFPAGATTTPISFTYASTTYHSFGTASTTNFTFGGVSGDQWTDFCISITGSADLCDGGDATGAGGGGADFTYNTDIGYGVTGSATTTKTQFTLGLHASGTSHFSNATSTLFTAVTGWFTDIYHNGVELLEQISDTVGAMVSGNTETDITVTYDDTDNTLDFVVDTLPNLTGTLDVDSGGTGATTLTDHGVLVGSGTAAITPLAVGTNGQLLVGSTGADPVFATLNCADGLSCTTGAGTLEIDFDGADSPQGELGGTWASPTIDDSLSVTSWVLTTPSLLTSLSVSDDDWIGLGSSAGLIEYDDQTTDEVNILNAKMGIGTSTPLWPLNVYSTGSQLALSNGAGIAQWAFRNAGGNLYISTTTAQGLATTSISALEISGSGFGTTTVRGLNINGQATTTSNVGFDTTGGCIAMNGDCLATQDGYVLQFHHSNLTTVVDNANYYFGNFALTPNTSDSTYNVRVPVSGTVTAATCNFANSAGASSENATANVRINGSTSEAISSSIAFNTTLHSYSNTSMSLSVTAGDAMAIHLDMPTWATNPGNLNSSCAVFIRTNY